MKLSPLVCASALIALMTQAGCLFGEDPVSMETPSPGQPPADMRADVGGQDPVEPDPGSGQDMGVGQDLALEDMPRQDLSLPDMPGADMPAPDMPAPDMPAPDMPAPDMAPQDMGQPDMAPPGPGCGDGVLQGGESCDDKNARAGDGCDASCQIEPGFLCPTAGRPCQRVLSVGAKGTVTWLQGIGSNPILIGASAYQAPCPGELVAWELSGFSDSGALGRTALGCASMPVTPSGLVARQHEGPTSPFGQSMMATLPKRSCPMGAVAVGYSGYSAVGGSALDRTPNVTGVHLFCSRFEVRDGQVSAASNAVPQQLSVYGFMMGMASAMQLCPPGQALTGASGDAGQLVQTLRMGCQPLVPLVVCGDGIISAGETCDDGNAVSGDGCSTVCRREP